MTRKDYILIEGILQDEYRWAPNPSKELGAIYRVAYMLGDALAKQDKNFDRAHFLAVVRGEKELTSKPKPRNLALEIASGLNNQTRRD